MKLKNNLIVTLPDFANHFDYAEFWENRKQFVRDMHPSKAYYWNEALKEAYTAVACWIDRDEAASEEERMAGIHALESLIGRPIEEAEINLSTGNVDLEAPVIRVQAGTNLSLPECTEEDACGEIALRYHKIEVSGHSGKPVTVAIGTGQSIVLHTGEFAYVTEQNGRFAEFLPTHLQNKIYDMSLVSQEGDFAATLHVRALFSGNQLSYKGVVSFALTDDGYLFIDSNRKPIIMSNGINALKFMLKHDGEAFYVKARNGSALILYSDGTLKSTQGMEHTGKVIRAEISK